MTGTRAFEAANRRRGAAVLAAAALPPGVLLGLVGLVGGPVVAAAAFVFVTAFVAGAVWLTTPWRVARRIGGREADPAGHARLVNLVEGLCAGAGIPMPRLVVVDDAGLNALAAGRGPKEATIAVTSGLLDRLTRIELEGVLAEAMVRLKRLDSLPPTLAAGAGPIARRFARPAEGDDGADLGAVALTRYPPGLASALEKMVTEGAVVAPPAGRLAELWLVDPSPTGPGAAGAPPVVHPGSGRGGERLPVDERVEALREL